MLARIIASLLAWSLLLTAEVVLAQIPPPEDNPNLSLKIFGEVNALARQSDGGLVLGGSFTSIDGEPRNNLARLRPDRSLDPDWTPAADGPVHALAIDATGAVFAGGDFLHINGLARQRLAKLDGAASGAPDPDWDPAANARVIVLAFDSTTGALFAGGWFTQIDGQERPHLAKLATNAGGPLDSQWIPQQNILIEEMVVVPGALYAGGIGSTGPTFFPSIGKFHTTGTGARVDGWVAERGGPYSLGVDPNSGALLVGGSGRITRLSGDTGAITGDWTPAGLGAARFTAMAIDNTSGTVYAGSTFRLARFSLSGVHDVAWAPNLSGAVRALALGANGSVVAGGTFSLAGGETHLSLATFDAAGNVSGPVDIEQPGSANLLGKQPDGGVIVAGNFYKADGLPRRGLLRLDPQGRLDADWNPSPGSNSVMALAVDAGSGDVYIGGDFNSIGGQTRYYLAKLSGTGTGALDPVWNPSANDWVTALAVDDTGAVFVGGLFEFTEGGGQSSIGGQQRDYLAKLSGTGTGAVDPDWKPEPNAPVYALAVESDGSVYAGGQFTAVGGQERAFIAKLDGSGAATVDADWNPSADNIVRGIVADGAGSVYARGAFTSIGAQSRSSLAKLSANGMGGVDLLWNPAPNGNVNGIALGSSGEVYVGGLFTAIGGQPRNYLAKLSAVGSGAADLRWNPGPSAPGVASVSFDANTGVVYVAGTFTSVGGQPRNGLAAIAPPLFSDGFETATP